MSKASSIPGSVRDVVGYGKPPKVSWPGGARIVIVVNDEEGSELAVGDGDAEPQRAPSELAARPWPAGKRDLAMETMQRDGARARLRRADGHLHENDVRGSFHVRAVALERNRTRAARAIRERGHDVVGHGYRWEDVTLLSREQEREHIRRPGRRSPSPRRPASGCGRHCCYGPSVNMRELVVEEGGFVDRILPTLTTTTCPTGRPSTARSIWSSRRFLANN